MDTIYSITKLLTPSFFMVSLDLGDALHDLLAHASQQHLCPAQYGMSISKLCPLDYRPLQDLYKSNGGSSGASEAKRDIDLLFCQVLTDLQTTRAHLKNLSWLLNLEKKSNLDPAQEIKFLGYIINSVL